MSPPAWQLVLSNQRELATQVLQAGGSGHGLQPTGQPQQAADDLVVVGDESALAVGRT